MNKHQETDINLSNFDILQEKSLDLFTIQRSICPKFMKNLGKNINKNQCKKKQNKLPIAKIIITKAPVTEFDKGWSTEQNLLIHKREGSTSHIKKNRTYEFKSSYKQGLRREYSPNFSKKSSSFKVIPAEEDIRLVNMRNKFQHLLNTFREDYSNQDQKNIGIMSSKHSLKERFPEISFYEKKGDGFEVWL